MKKNRFSRVGLSLKFFSLRRINSRYCILFAIICCLSAAINSRAGLKIYYIRHAEGGHNVVGEWKDIPKARWPAYVGNINVFTPKGNAQVAAAADKLQKYHFDFIAVSPSWRTRHTVLPYLKAVNAKGEIWPELNEYSSDLSLVLATNLPLPADKILGAGAAITLPADEAGYFHFHAGDDHEFKLRPLRDEEAHNADVRFVLQKVIEKIHAAFGGTDKSILLVGHGNSGKDLLKLLMNDPLKDVPEIANTGIWMVEEQPDGRFKLEMFNDAPFKSRLE